MTLPPLSAGQDALARLRKVAEAGRDPAAWTAFVAALRAGGQKGRARKAAKSAPLSADARRRLQKLADGQAEKGTIPSALTAGLSRLLREGRFADMRREARRFLDLYPDAPEITAILGLAALMEEDLVEAEIHLRRALAGDEGNVDLLSNLGLALVWQGRAHEAIELLEPHAGSVPRAATLRVNLASAYLRAAREGEALDLAQDIVSQAPQDVDALGVLFAAALSLGKTGLARQEWDKLEAAQRDDLVDVEIELIELEKGRDAALARLEGLDPDAALRARLTQKLAAWGEFDTAARLLREGLLKGEGGHQAFRKLGQVIRWSAEDPLLPQLEAEAGRRDQSPGRRVSLLLSLAKARADTGDATAAFEATREGKALWATAVGYDSEAERASMERRLEIWTAARVDELGRDGPVDWHPVFIIGLPRSGSTLMETVLGRHPLVRSIGENPRAFDLATRVAPTPDDISRMRDALQPLFAPRVSGERITDKLLANFKMVGPLLAAFPKARFLFPDRDPRATGLSIFENPLPPVDQPYSLTLERIARHMVNCDRMMRAWEERFPAQVRRISYEDLVSDPDAQVPLLIEAAGLDWDPAVADQSRAPRRIDTLSVAQARAPISRSSVARWRRHEADLAPMIAILEKAGLIADKA